MSTARTMQFMIREIMLKWEGHTEMSGSLYFCQTWQIQQKVKNVVNPKNCMVACLVSIQQSAFTTDHRNSSKKKKSKNFQNVTNNWNIKSIYDVISGWNSKEKYQQG